jgi:hypothetical protein
MSQPRENQAFSRTHRRAPLLVSVLVLLFVLQPGTALAQSAPDAPADTSNELTLEQFRSLVAAHLSEASQTGKKSHNSQSPPDLRSSDEIFLQLLLIQARDAAAHQSVDRLSGWTKAVQSRLQTQTAPELDAAVLRFEQAKVSSESARIEAEQKRIIERANGLLGRPADTALLALLPPSVDSEFSAIQDQAKEVLTQGEDLIAQMYKSYEYGGISVIELLEYEQILYEFEIEYRESLAQDAMNAATAASN